MRKANFGTHNFLVANGVLNTPPLNDDAIRIWGQNWQNVCDHYSSYLLNIQAQGSPGPIEKHPYIDTYHSDFDFHREILLFGTFPPSSYMNNWPVQNLPNPNVQNNNPTHYFYGNVNDLWLYLFGLNHGDLTIQNIQKLLSENSISISDVFAFVQRKNLISPDDKEYVNIVLNCKIKEVFNKESRVNTILFTSGSLAKVLGQTTSALTGFRWILEDCFGGLEDFTISGDITGNGLYHPLNAIGVLNALIQQEDGIVWWLKHGTKKIRIINLPSPSPNAARGMKNSPFFRKWLNYKANINALPPFLANENVNNYLNNYPEIFNAPYTRQYRQDVYQMVLNNTIHLI